MVDPLLQLVAALLLALVFAAGAWSKLAAREEFEGVVGNYRILPEALVRPFALALPPAEALVALLLVVPATRPTGALGAIALLVTFVVAIGVNIRRGRTEIDCGCFRSAHRQVLSWWLVGRNAVLALFAIALLAPPTGRALGLVDLAQVPFAVGALFLVYLAIGGAFLPRPPTFDENYARSLAGERR
ncbi:MauE/DoxX family redox-associated membrane protein [Faunimonas sp. B44]|uniref:MauE/DoxX family redox-associated membrane protein n=1 Tax=Faunimonas sp. B44 TaxID=3461493 RepID=UPI004043E7A9